MSVVVVFSPGLHNVHLVVVWQWATELGLPQRILRVLCGYFAHQRRLRHEDSVRTFGAKCFLRMVMQDVMTKFLDVVTGTRIRARVDDIKFHFASQKKKLPHKRNEERRFETLKSELTEVEPDLSLTEGHTGQQQARRFSLLSKERTGRILQGEWELEMLEASSILAFMKEPVLKVGQERASRRRQNGNSKLRPKT